MTGPRETARPEDTPGLDIVNLASWLPAHVPGFGSDFTPHLLAGGRSNVSYRLTDTGGRSVVLRRPPLGHVMPTAHDMSREYRVMSGLNSVGFPAPHALALCEDPAVTGAPFMVMDFVDGRTIDDRRAAATLTAHEADLISRALVDTLADLHAVDPAQAGLATLGRPLGYLERQVRRWGQQWELSRTRSNSDVDRLLAMLTEAVPAVSDQTAGTLVHGDYRIDNVIVDRLEPRIVAVVDWEMATLGDPLSDLAVLLVYWTGASDSLRALVPVAEHITDGAGFWSREDIATHYAQRSGLDLGQLDVYVGLACLKLAVIMESIHRRNLDGLQLGAASGADIGMAQATDALARLGLGTMELGAFTALSS